MKNDKSIVENLKRLRDSMRIPLNTMESFLDEEEYLFYTSLKCSPYQAIEIKNLLYSKGASTISRRSEMYNLISSLKRMEIIKIEPTMLVDSIKLDFTHFLSFNDNVKEIKIIGKKKSKQTPEVSFNKDDIQSRVKTILSAPVSTQGIIDTFEALCVPFDQECERREFYLSIFHSAGIDAYWDDSMGVIIPPEKKLKKTIVSHMDLIKVFNKGFRKGKVITSLDDIKLTAALDNTITNAVLIKSLLTKRDKNTAYLFTLDEETHQYAMRDYMKKFGTKQFVVNLDVTDVGISQFGNKESDVSIEFDEPNWSICKQLEGGLVNPSIQKERECDDLDEVVKAGGYGFSYCLPTGNNIHSYKNWCFVDSIQPYYNGLNFIIHKLDTSDKDKNMKHVSVSMALSCESISEVEALNIKPKEFVSTSHYSYTGLDVEERDTLFDHFYQTQDLKLHIQELHFEFIQKLLPETDSQLIADSLFESSTFIAEDGLRYISDMKEYDRYLSVLGFLLEIGILSESLISFEDNRGSYDVEYDFDYYTKYMRLLSVIMEYAPHIDIIKFHDFYQLNETVQTADLYNMFNKKVKDGTKHSEVIDIVYQLAMQDLLEQDDKTLQIL